MHLAFDLARYTRSRLLNTKLLCQQTAQELIQLQVVLFGSSTLASATSFQIRHHATATIFPASAIAFPKSRTQSNCYDFEDIGGDLTLFNRVLESAEQMLAVLRELFERDRTIAVAAAEVEVIETEAAQAGRSFEEIGSIGGTRADVPFGLDSDVLEVIGTLVDESKELFEGGGGLEREDVLPIEDLSGLKIDLSVGKEDGGLVGGASTQALFLAS